MKILLDTQVWLWLCKSPEKVSKRTRRQLQDERNELPLSAASVWEIAEMYSHPKLFAENPFAIFRLHSVGAKSFSMYDSEQMLFQR